MVKHPKIIRKRHFLVSSVWLSFCMGMCASKLGLCFASLFRLCYLLIRSCLNCR